MDLSPRAIRENYLRAVSFNHPAYIPCIVFFPLPTWRRHGRKLEKLVESHRILFPGFRRGSINYAAPSARPPVYRDEWGCLWRFTADGLQGIVVESPLRDWRRLPGFRPPDPELGLPREGEPPIPWDHFEEFVRSTRSAGGLTVGFVHHGFLVLRLSYLRGYLNLLKDVVTEPPQLEKLIDMVTEYNVEVVKRVAKAGVDVISFGDDLGTQAGLPFSPEKFRRLFLPGYRRVFSIARKGGARVRFHTDGYVMGVIEDIVSAGVDVVNIQVDLNGLERVKARLRGKVAVEASLDERKVLPFSRPAEIDGYVRRIIGELGSRRGGLLINAEVLHDVPLENIKALLDSLESHITLHRELPD